MGKETRKEDEELILNLYTVANSEIELLREYYELSYNNLEDTRNTIEEKYKVGAKINDLLDKIVNKKTFEVNNEKLQEANNIILFDNIKFSDVIKNINVNKEKKKILFSINKKYKYKNEINPNIASKKYSESKQYEIILSRSILSDIIVTFELVLSKLLNILALKDPFFYLENETLPLANFFRSEFTKTLINKIDSTIEKKMYDSMKALTEVIDHEKIQVEKETLIQFKEIYYRRNVAIHNDNNVNKKYLDSIDSSLRKGIKEGDKLIYDKIYFEKAFDVITKLFFFIFYGVLQKYTDNKDISYISKIADFAFKKLQDKDYAIAKIIYKTISTNNKLEFINKMMYRINYLNAVKQLGETEILNKELNTLDVSIATDDFKIAKLCLQNDNAKIYKSLSKTYPKSFSSIEIKNWPLFVNFRESEEYAIFCKEHAEDFLNEELLGDSAD